MADALRKQIRDGAVDALDGLATTGARVYENRLYPLQAVNLPGLRVYTDSEDMSIAGKGELRERMHALQLIVECCSKKSTAMDDELDAMIKEVIERLDGNQDIAGVKFIEPTRIEIDMDAESEKEIGVARVIFTVPYYTRQGALDVAN